MGGKLPSMVFAIAVGPPADHVSCFAKRLPAGFLKSIRPKQNA